MGEKWWGNGGKWWRKEMVDTHMGEMVDTHMVENGEHPQIVG